MRFEIITIFPQIFESFKNEALISRAQKKKIASINIHNLRDFTADNHKTVDGRPYGGGVGMVMMVEPILKAVRALRKLKTITQKSKVIIFSPKGKRFTQDIARKWSKLDQLIMICGRYEGIDERVAKHIADEEISIGDYVLFGGEVPAMAVMEAVTRLLPGAVGKEQSVKGESFSEDLFANLEGTDQAEAEGILEYPHYTRPEIVKIDGKNRHVPKVLLTGDHKKIESWRREQSVKITKQHRPDLLKN